MVETFRHRIRSAVGGWEWSLGEKGPFKRFVRLRDDEAESLTDAIMPAVEQLVKEATERGESGGTKKGTSRL